MVLCIDLCVRLPNRWAGLNRQWCRIMGALKSRSESNDSWHALWSPVLNQMIRDTRFEVPFWIKWFATRALKSRVLNQMIRDTRFEVPWGTSSLKMSPKNRSAVRTSPPRQPSGKDHWNQWSPYNDFAAVGTNYWFVWPEGNCPPPLNGFFSILSPMGVLVLCRCRLWLA